MTQPEAVRAALHPLQELLAKDGYDLRVIACDEGEVVLQIEAGPDACADCLVPKSIMMKYVDAEFAKHPEIGEVTAELRYPADYRREN